MKPYPLISVVMPVYNTGKYLAEAIESILNQEFTDFEFFIVDDGSTDNSPQVIQSYNDPRIRLITHATNLGNYPARNEAMQLARGKYICVMDSDDIARPDRLITQYNFMEYYPHYVALGSFVHLLYDNTPPVPFVRKFDEDECRVALLRDNVCTHPSLILRRETLVSHNIRYNEEYYYAADFDILVQLTKVGDVSNIPSFLLYYRKHSEQISRAKFMEQQMYANLIRLDQLTQFGVIPTPQERDLHLKLLAGQFLESNEIVMAEKWTDKLLKQNKKLSLFHQQVLTSFLKEELLSFYR